jgi:RND family efflux transporter MFP subunit
MNKITKTLLPVLLIVIGLIIGGIIIKTTKQPEKKLPQRTAYVVEVSPLQASKQAVRLQLTGTVSPALEIILSAKVAGEITKASPEFIDGGFFEKGAFILKIDPVDYQLALEQKKAALAEAEYLLKLEEGQGEIAALEWDLLESNSEEAEADRDLATRKPHLKYRSAKLKAAKAELEKAELDLERTEIRAPFNAVVVERVADLGAQATVQGTLATLAGSDQYFIRVSIPVDELRWVECDPKKGSLATITRNTGDVRKGRVVRMESAIEEMGRMARIIIAVDNPLQGKQPMLLNEYVHVVIEGSAIENAYLIPRSALHDDRYVWLATPEGTLEIRKVVVSWRSADDVIVTDGLNDGERLVLTNLSTPIDGINLRIADEMQSVKGPKIDEQ